MLLNKNHVEAEEFDERRFESLVSKGEERNEDVNRVINAWLK